MILERVRLKNFRNHVDSACDFGPGVNALLGDNGQGKTNVLEAISFLGLTKSFYAASDVRALQAGKDFFEIAGTIKAAAGTTHAVRIAFDRISGEKRITIDESRPETIASVIGQFPVVILSPEHNAITFGGPAERRRFLDIVLSQASRPYLRNLFEYRRVLRQRNRMLADARIRGTSIPASVDAWDEGLVKYGSAICAKRAAFLQEFRGRVIDAYRELAGNEEQPDVHYRPSSTVPEGGTVEECAAELRNSLEHARDEERRRGLTMVGPHRDELALAIDGLSVQQHASQGQHKTLLVALKVAEFLYMRDTLGERPMFLLDDVFSELDARRSVRILAMTSALGQTIITTTDELVFRNAVRWNDDNRKFLVERGKCTRT